MDIVEEGGGGDMALSNESSANESSAERSDATAVGPAVKAAIRDNRDTWAEDRGANVSYETLEEVGRLWVAMVIFMARRRANSPL